MQGPTPHRALGLLAPVAVFALWAYASHAGLVAETLLVSPRQTWRAFEELLRQGQLQTDLQVSLGRLLSGFLFGSGLGVLAGILTAMSRTADEALSPLLQFLRQIPSVVFIPVFMLLFGVQEFFKIAIISKAAFFPVVLATHDGIRNVSSRHLEVARAYLLTPLQRIHYVILPATVPAVVAGLRIGLGRSWLLLVAAELLAADSGIGYTIQMGRQMFRIDVIVVGIIVIGIVGFVIDRVFLLLERRYLAWRPTA